MEAQASGSSPLEGLFPAPPEIEQIAHYLISRYFPHLQELRIVLLARESVLEAEDGQVTVAATGVSSNPEDPFDCIFWFAMDVWEILEPNEKEAIIFHELMHCDHDGMGHGDLKPHDAGVFTQEVQIYGAWWERPSKVLKEMRGE